VQNRAEYDYWVVCDGLIDREVVVCPSQNVILVTWEPPERHYGQRFIDQFAGVATCHPNLKHPNVQLTHQGHPWHIPRTYDELKSSTLPSKTKLASVITSNKQFYEGHRSRLAFVTRLKAALGDQIDLFGRGINTFDTKWEVLAPYRYTIAIENAFEPHWITEKLADCFLTETFPFYAGAPNAADYFPADSFMAIDIADPPHAIQAIAETLASPTHYDSVLPALQQAKSVYLDQQSLFPLLTRLLDHRFNSDEKATAQPILLKPEYSLRPLWRRVLRRALEIRPS
jgi:hypothetical protein